MVSSPPFERLMQLKMEPRVWKMVFELFPGPLCLLSGGEASPFLAQPPQRAPTSLSASPSLETVTDAPIASPQGHRGGPGQSYQPEGWDFDSETKSQTGSTHSRTYTPPASSAFPWAHAFDRSSNPAFRQSEILSQPPAASQNFPGDNWVGVVQLMQQCLAELEKVQQRAKRCEEELENSVGDTFKAMALANASLKEQLNDAQQKLMSLQAREPSYPGERLLDQALSQQKLQWIVDRVKGSIDLSHLATREDLRQVSAPAEVPPEMNQRLDAVEGEVFNNAGSLPQLISRVETLEAARAVTAVEVGGFIFTDEAATDAWAQTHGNKDLHRFCPDFFSYFLLADPKFETIEGGLQQAAAVAKAQFASREVATIDLSFSMTYPPRMLKTLDKPEAQVTDGIVWAPQYSSFAVFEGDFSNGTHLRTKRALIAAAKAVDDGIDYNFPAATFPKTHAVFRAQSRLALTQCLEFLDCLGPLFREISGGGLLGAKDAWLRCGVFGKQVFDDIRTVRAPNAEATAGSFIWAAFHTTELLKEYQRHNWVQHPKTSALLALTNMRVEGKLVEEMQASVKSQNVIVSRHTGDIKKLQDDLSKLKKNNPSLN